MWKADTATVILVLLSDMSQECGIAGELYISVWLGLVASVKSRSFLGWQATSYTAANC